MNSIPAIVIFDIGKTNKKWFVFDAAYNILLEKSIQFEEVKDEDGDACEDVNALTYWVKMAITELMDMKDFDVVAINFSTYGASFVHLDKEGQPVAPLYNYLKPFPDKLQKKFYREYGGETAFSIQTASPVLGNLNSGLQLYYLKEEKTELFKKIHTSLHLPQYVSYLVSGRLCSDITSIGCHTGLWNFTLNRYHDWLYKEHIAAKLAPIFPSDQLRNSSWEGKPLLCGAGLHDSSAALIPYLYSFKEPFILISTGTWCISLNPFNQTRLTAEELKEDCLCYMEYRGKPIKASRLFAGYEHELQVKRLAAHFNVKADEYKDVTYDTTIMRKLKMQNSAELTIGPGQMLMKESVFGRRDLQQFKNYTEAYHRLIMDIISLQVSSTVIVLKGCNIKKIFVDGGFGKNPVYMNLLAASFPEMEVYAASVAQASAIGAALAVHPHWNKNDLPAGLINLKHYAGSEAVEI